MKKLTISALAAAFLVALAACGGQGARPSASSTPSASTAPSGTSAPTDKGTITYSKSQGPYTELFEAAIVPILEKEGYTLKAEELSDLLAADIALNDGEVDVNVEQHTAYLENFNANYNGDLTPISPIPTVPAGIYSSTYESLDEV